MKLDEIKANHVKTIDSLDMKISTTTSNKYSSSYEQLSSDITKCKIIISSDKYSHVSQSTKHFYSMNLEGNNLLQLQNSRIPFFLTSANTYQQTIYGWYTNLLKHQNMIYINFPPTGHPYKVIHSKGKLSSILKSTSISPCQGYNYSFVYSTKITRQTYELY